MLETDIKKFRDLLVLKLDNAENLELHWEAKAYTECIKMLDPIFTKNGIEAT
jgi:hypothetical protein